MKRRFLALATAAVALLLCPAPSLAACQLGQMLELKVTMVGMQPLVSAKINGHDVQFVADSGAFFSNLTPGNVAELKLPLRPAPPGFYIIGVGGNSEASIATVDSLVLGGVALPHVEFLVGGSEVGVVGLLGENVLGFADTEYDLENGVIRLMKAEKCTATDLAYWSRDKPISTIDIEPHSKHYQIIGSVLLNGSKTRATFDTGASSSILSLSAAARLGIRPTSPGVKPAGSTRGLGHRMVQTWIAPIDSLKIGDEEIRHFKMRIGDIGIDSTDMLIGADFFLSHRVYVSNLMHKLSFTYDGGPVFNITPARVVDSDGTVQQMPTADDAVPTDAQGFSRRGAAYASRKQYDLAIADFSKAIALAPTDAGYVYQRALARLEAKRTLPAMADLDRTLELDPGNVDARMTRAALRIEVPDKAEARDDIDAAEKLVAKPSDKRLEIGALYEQVDAFDDAVAQFDLWIQAHPDDSRRGEALNDRCWARAQMGRALDKALADCNTALRLQPHTAMILDSRGLVHLRQGDLDKAIADYDAGLALAPRMAWSLYGRGIAETRKGLKSQGDADLAAAAAINPKLPDRAKALGVTP